ncbi:A/G-specific adenine glycosylase [Halobacteriovorax sp. HLS]|uniref:A/G-specific adenine glycosylase n=1 Tax=Halobacteriovorax sp. HLS TaxID=2234000 RepID=UPI0013E30413|nr:A/G-specific adenine glycosylase [Halobacteriovorax sp. HLS]
MLTKLQKWSQSQHSHLIWRKNRSLYLTLVSEIMLQQTTVSTVSNHIESFLKKFPDLKTLSKASEDEVCIAWKGLGYYRRARNLLNAAKEIQTNFNGEIPLDFNELKKIKGIGDYTANAILAIGGNKRALALDANLERVIARFYGIKTIKGVKLQKDIYERFSNKEILPQMRNGNARKINEALMDLGRVYCQARKADCLLCPISKDCISYNQNLAHIIPVKESVAKEKFELELLRIIVKDRKKILGYVKSDKEWLQGQVELPTFILSSEDKTLKQYPVKKMSISTKELKSFKTTITKYKIKNYILELSKDRLGDLGINLDDYTFRSSDINKTNFSTASIKALRISN